MRPSAVYRAPGNAPACLLAPRVAALRVQGARQGQPIARGTQPSSTAGELRARRTEVAGNRGYVVCYAWAGASKKGAEEAEAVARSNLKTMGAALGNLGWLAFWTQFSLSVVSAVMSFFSVIFSKPSSVSSSLTLSLVFVGVACGLLSTYWAFGYIQLSKKIRRCLAKGMEGLPKRGAVERNLGIGSFINVVGMGSSLVGLQAVVGFLVAKTLANATANPFLSGGAGSWNPVLALDVFLIQAATNILLSHFISLCFNMWLQRKIKQLA